MAYHISSACISCGACESECPVSAISEADGQERLIIADIDLSDRGGSQTASVSGTETARVVRMMETESGLGMLTVNYVVMAELRRI